jgi:ferredoxin
MKVVVDRDKCVGLGICEATAPDVFEIDDDGALMILADDIAPDQLGAVRAAVDGCPTEALRLITEMNGRPR